MSVILSKEEIDEILADVEGGGNMKDLKSEVPVFDMAHGRYEHTDPGMATKEYAAIHLKVPRSGDEELDAMIRESRRADLAECVMTWLLAWETDGNVLYTDVASKRAFEFADAVLAEWEKEEKE